MKERYKPIPDHCCPDFRRDDDLFGAFLRFVYIEVLFLSRVFGVEQMLMTILCHNGIAR